MKKIKELDLIKFVQDVYSLSSPQEMGFLHYRVGDEMTTEQAKEILARFPADKRLVLRLDYIRGRACKMSVYRSKGGGYELPDSWFDHTRSLNTLNY